MEMGSLAQFLPMLMQMMQQNRPPVATPGINPTAQQMPQPGAFGPMPGLSQMMSQRAPVELFNSVNPMGTGGLKMYATPGFKSNSNRLFDLLSSNEYLPSNEWAREKLGEKLSLS